MRRAVGDAAGLTIKGQIRRSAENLGYTSDAWRIREAFYGRTGGWSAAALDDLRRRFATWRDPVSSLDPSGLAQRVASVRRLLAELERQVAGLEAVVARSEQRDGP